MDSLLVITKPIFFFVWYPQSVTWPVEWGERLKKLFCFCRVLEVWHGLALFTCPEDVHCFWCLVAHTVAALHCQSRSAESCSHFLLNRKSQSPLVFVTQRDRKRKWPTGNSSPTCSESSHCTLNELTCTNCPYSETQCKSERVWSYLNQTVKILSLVWHNVVRMA